jgi:hypothetical protein
MLSGITDIQDTMSLVVIDFFNTVDCVVSGRNLESSERVHSLDHRESDS